ncbi:hypothetical protein JMJ35_004485 [Cladonia borealis]|uniref:Uncharacterized protein n=1 Tax=Cladonia borealis TaxID=184061 RepID=A0AA39R4H9_9LECA|nr:hypothetical protein JMJ35_004485 [Cladonia borealis]
MGLISHGSNRSQLWLDRDISCSRSRYIDCGSLSEEEDGSRIAHLHALPECDSPGHDAGSDDNFVSFGRHECISDSKPPDAFSAYSLPLRHRHTDLEMAMGPYSDGYRSGVEGGRACDCIVSLGLADGPTCSTIPYPSDNLSIYARAKTGECSLPATICASSDRSDTWFWIGGRTASNPSAFDEGCQTYQSATVFTMNEKDPDLIVVDFGFGHIRARGISRERRHDASLATSPALICLEEGSWQQIRCAGDCNDRSDRKGCLARLVKLHGFDPMSEVNGMDKGQKDILEKKNAFNSCFSALQKMRMASSARAKLGNKEDKQVTEHFERLMEDASIQLKELDRRAGNTWILNKPGARSQTCQHIHPAHRVQGMLEVYKSAIDVARSLSAARRLTQESHNVSIEEKTLQTPRPPHTLHCNKSGLYELGACSTSSTFKMRWDSRRPDLLIDTACLLFGAIAGPPIQWVTLRSMHIGSNSVLDQKILQVLPISAKLVASLESHQNAAMALMFSSTSMSVALLCKVAATTTGNGRSAVFICFWLAMVLGASVWNTIGGSAAEFFPVFLPVATTIGATYGLLCQRR